MINMGKPPGAGAEDGFPSSTRPALKTWKLLAAFALLGVLLVMGYALKPAAGSGGLAAASGMVSAEPDALAPESPSEMALPQTVSGIDSVEAATPHQDLLSDPMVSGESSALFPVRLAIPGQVRDILLGLSALGMMALSAAMVRAIGGCKPGGSLCGFRIHFGFFRHLSDRPPFGRASGRRGGEA